MAETLTDLERRAPRAPALPAQAKAATIRSTASSISDLVLVSVDSQPGYNRGPCRWPQGGPLPQEGDAAAVIELNDGRLWIVAVWSTDPVFPS